MQRSTGPLRGHALGGVHVERFQKNQSQKRAMPRTTA